MEKHIYMSYKQILANKAITPCPQLKRQDMAILFFCNFLRTTSKTFQDVKMYEEVMEMDFNLLIDVDIIHEIM